MSGVVVMVCVGEIGFRYFDERIFPDGVAGEDEGTREPRDALSFPFVACVLACVPLTAFPFGSPFPSPCFDGIGFVFDGTRGINETSYRLLRVNAQHIEVILTSENGPE